MENVLLTNYRTIVARGDLNGNVDETVLNSCILYAQKYEVLPVIGQQLYDRLKAGILAGDLTLGYMKLLDDYILPVMVPATLAKAVFRLTFRIANVGLVNNRSDNNNSGSYSDVQKVSDEYTADAKKAAGELSCYLREKYEDFPEYRYTGCGCNDSDNTYDVGIYLGL